MSALRPYWAVLSARFRMMLQYRAAAIAGFATQIFWGWIRVMIFEAFYRSSSAAQPMTVQQTVNYVWLGQALLMLLPGRIDGEIRAMVRNGSVAYELLRPLDLYSFWYCRALAGSAAPTFLRCAPLLVLAWLFFGLELPPSWACAAAFVVSTASAFLLAAAIATLLNISLLWTISGEGITQIVPTLVVIFSGLIIPLPLFPDWAQPILNALPFRGLGDVPFRLYSGNLPPEQLWSLLAGQLAWTAALILLGRWLLARGARRLVVQGG
jgi:ABC-2 type transport system permease protein